MLGVCHDMWDFQHCTKTITEEMHLMSTRIGIRISRSIQVKKWNCFGGCAVVDWSFHGGNCSFPGILTHPRSMMLAKCTGKTSTDVLSCGSVVILSICVWNRRADFSVSGTAREERRRESERHNVRRARKSSKFWCVAW